MTAESNRQRVAAALAVEWSPTLAARVRRRLDAAIVRSRQRRHAVVLAVALLAFGGLSYAFSRAWRPLPPPSPPAKPTPANAPERGGIARPANAPPDATITTPPAGGKTALPTPARRSPAPAGRAATPPETVESLFAAADAARIEGRFGDAVAPLTAIFTRFPSDPRAAVAAFQLGRVLSDDLDQPAAAAAAFSRAFALDPKGPLAADAAERTRAALERAQPAAP